MKITTADGPDPDGPDPDGGLPLVKRRVRLCPWSETVVVEGGSPNRVLEALSKRSRPD